MLSFQIVHVINQMMALNTVETTTMIITITITGAIFYVKDNSLCRFGTAFEH